MIVVACACNDYAPRQVETDRKLCKRCGLVLSVLLDVDENKERIARGVALDAWFAAPRTPATRDACENALRPCVHLRCRHQLGAPGRYGCSLDVAEEAPTAPDGNDSHAHHTLEYVGDRMNIGRERVRQLEAEASLDFLAAWLARTRTA